MKARIKCVCTGREKSMCRVLNIKKKGNNNKKEFTGSKMMIKKIHFYVENAVCNKNKN